jgi:putative oxidoreductase
MDFNLLTRWQPQLLALLRIVTALVFMEHGTAKLFHFPVAQPGAPDPLPTMLLAAALIELVCGALITLGLFTRLAAFIAAGEMAVAYFMAHFPKGFWPIVNMGGEAILLCFVFLYLAAAGAGAWSIDGMRARNAPIR